MTDEKTKNSPHTFTVGLISDTHGFLPPEVAAVFNGVDHIIHAGDILNTETISELQRMAPTTAVLGNMDEADRFGALSETAVVDIGGVHIYALHDLNGLDLDPVAAGLSGVVYGHTHRSDIQWQRGVMYVNPGSAGEPRSGRPPSVALLQITNKSLTARIVHLS
jgi:hypothetical protein